ncbi:MAG TPA: sulfatase-like hydrolase/transferase [Lentisphaeria bacterium]|nr:sulfatase-like hydrolase/transferase [Lentisphaeria bacterium]
MANQHPNILLIVADQHRADCLGVNGHPIVQTPCLDKLASEGANFTSAFTSSPICVPARNSLLHGVWPCRHLSIANADTEAPRPAAALPAFPEILAGAGYDLTFIGKWLGGSARAPQDYGFHHVVPEKDYQTWRAEQKLPPRPGGLPFYGCDDAITPAQSRLAWGADHVIAALRKATPERPFLVRWDPSEPHLPNVVPKPFADMYDPERIPPWPSFTDDFRDKPYIQSQQLRSWGIEEWTWKDWAPLVAQYLGDISLLDSQIGRILGKLQQLGLDRNTVVIYTCDHGDLCGAHRMFDKHYVMYDDVVRIPLIIRWPGVTAPGTIIDDCVIHTLDLAVTLCELAGQDAPESFQGRSLMPALKDLPRQPRQDVLAMYHGNQFGLFTQRMVRTRQWKYVWNATDRDELYDLENDPAELTNLAAEESTKEIMAQMRRRLHQWMVETGDPLNNSWIRRQLLQNRKI